MLVTPLRPSSSFPTVISPEDPSMATTLTSWLRSERASVMRVLVSCGAVLFRDFQLRTSDDFAAVLGSFESELRRYIEGQSPRQQVAAGIYTSTEYPARFAITLHNELSYAKSPPRRIHFYCCTPPESGGETPMVEGRRLLRALPQRIVEKFRKHGIRYVKVMHGGTGLGKSWQEHFETDSRDTVESYLRASDVQWEWRSNGSLRTSQLRPAVIKHPESQEEVWFNQATLWHYSDRGKVGYQLLSDVGEANLPTNAYYGDGSAIDEDDLAEIRRITWEESVAFPWQSGDLLILDNCLMAHGRKPYAGSRRILVAMAD
jgi:alpha-ketoglutarate-dependent taurine dioxygenase